jgi:hypothetical protein
MRSLITHADPRTARAALRHAHRMLAARITALQATADDAFPRAFVDIVAAVEAGFRHDETILETIGHVDLHACLEDNAVILGALHRVMPWVEQGNVALGRQVAAALRDVLTLRRLACEASLAAGAAAASRMRARPPQPSLQSRARTLRRRP